MVKMMEREREGGREGGREREGVREREGEREISQLSGQECIICRILDDLMGSPDIW